MLHLFTILVMPTKRSLFVIATETLQLYNITIKGLDLEPATSCVRDQDATTVPARHMLN